jgi:predicted DNA-binding transcriptional regulator AlpA
MSPQPTADLPANDQFLPARAVWTRYGVTSMSLYRWLDDEELNFPRPVYLGRFRHWRLSELVAWEASRPRIGKPFRVSAHGVEVA